MMDLSGVQISIAPSNYPDAGRGAFLTSGLAEDGSVPPGTILTEYGGVHFTSPADIQFVESSSYHSDYLWGGLNPHTNVYTIVDAAIPTAGYGGFLNEGFEHSNTELVFGTDNKLYVSALTTISLNEELLLSYGAPFWLDPNRWYKLSKDTQCAILSFYKCSPPTELNPYLPSHPQEPAMDHVDIGCELASSTNQEDILQSDFINYDSEQDSSRSHPSTDLSPLELRRRMSLCFGSSATDNTRISLPYLDYTDPILYLLQDAMDATSTCSLAPHTLRQLLLTHPHVLLLYWKKQDDTHRHDSPPDGACGWHTLTQANYRRQTGTLLNLYDPSTLDYTTDFLTTLSDSVISAPAEGLGSISTAIQFIRNKHLTGSSAPLPVQHQLLSTDFATLSHINPASLFTQTPPGTDAYLRMPADHSNEWLSHFASTGPNRHNGLLPLSALPLAEILAISNGDTLAQLAFGHYWLFPNARDETIHCNQAIDEFAVSLWEASRGTTLPSMIPPRLSNQQDVILVPTHITLTPQLVRHSPLATLLPDTPNRENSSFLFTTI